MHICGGLRVTYFGNRANTMPRPSRIARALAVLFAGVHAKRMVSTDRLERSREARLAWQPGARPLRAPPLDCLDVPEFGSTLRRRVALLFVGRVSEAQLGSIEARVFGPLRAACMPADIFLNGHPAFDEEHSDDSRAASGGVAETRLFPSASLCDVSDQLTRWLSRSEPEHVSNDSAADASEQARGSGNTSDPASGHAAEDEAFGAFARAARRVTSGMGGAGYAAVVYLPIDRRYTRSLDLVGVLSAQTGEIVVHRGAQGEAAMRAAPLRGSTARGAAAARRSGSAAAVVYGRPDAMVSLGACLSSASNRDALLPMLALEDDLDRASAREARGWDDWLTTSQLGAACGLSFRHAAGVVRADGDEDDPPVALANRTVATAAAGEHTLIVAPPAAAQSAAASGGTRDECASASGYGTPRRRVALAFFGINRSLRWTFTSLERHVLAPLRAHCVQFDVYIHTYTDALVDNPRAGEVNVSLPGAAEMIELLQPVRYELSSSAQADAAMPLERFSGQGLHYPPVTARNLLRQFYSLERVTRLWGGKSSAYAAVAYLRPDLKYVRPLDVVGVLSVRMTEVFVPYWHSWTGFNDRLAIGHPLAMLIWGGRGRYAAEYSQLNRLHAESFLHWLLTDRHGLAVRYMSLLGLRIRATGRTPDVCIAHQCRFASNRCDRVCKELSPTPNCFGCVTGSAEPTCHAGPSACYKHSSLVPSPSQCLLRAQPAGQLQRPTALGYLSDGGPSRWRNESLDACVRPLVFTLFAQHDATPAILQRREPAADARHRAGSGVAAPAAASGVAASRSPPPHAGRRLTPAIALLDAGVPPAGSRGGREGRALLAAADSLAPMDLPPYCDRQTSVPFRDWPAAAAARARNRAAVCVSRHPFLRVLDEYMWLIGACSAIEDAKEGGSNPRPRSEGDGLPISRDECTARLDDLSWLPSSLVASACNPRSFQAWVRRSLREAELDVFFDRCHWVPQARYLSPLCLPQMAPRDENSSGVGSSASSSGGGRTGGCALIIRAEDLRPTSRSSSGSSTVLVASQMLVACRGQAVERVADLARELGFGAPAAHADASARQGDEQRGNATQGSDQPHSDGPACLLRWTDLPAGVADTVAQLVYDYYRRDYELFGYARTPPPETG
jgi:hypothetical protein